MKTAIENTDEPAAESVANSSLFPTDFLDAHELATLSAACARLIPQPEREPFLGIACTIDRRLAREAAGNWSALRFLDGEALRCGLRGLDQISRNRLRRDFAELDSVRQDQILFSLQNGTVAGAVWPSVTPRRFFEELLRECTEVYHTAPVTDEAVSI